MHDLISQVEEAVFSDENQNKLNNQSNTKLIVAIGRPVFADILGFSLMDYYRDPRICLTSQLQWKLFCHQQIKDDTPIDLMAGIDHSNALEPSFFGVKPVFSDITDPTYDQAVIRDPEDLDRLPLPDFFTSGLMPKIHEHYREMNQRAMGRLNIFLPGWARGPWSISTILRGFNNILLDSIDDPEFLHRLMQFTVDARIHFEKQRCQFLHISPQDLSYRWKYVTCRNNTNSDLFEDEVDGGVFSRETFLEYIHPYIGQIEAFYGGISYYHSCGNLTPFLPELSVIKQLKTLHISPWTNFEKAVEQVPQTVVLQKSLHPILDVADADEAQMEKKLRSIMDMAGGRKMEIWADGLYSGSWKIVQKAQLLVDIFRRIMA